MTAYSTDGHLMIGGTERPCPSCGGRLRDLPNAINEATGHPEPNKYRCSDCRRDSILVQVGPAKELSGAGSRRE